MPASSRNADQPTKPTFVFQGTIQKVKSATMKQVPIDDRTAVVAVDQVLEAPENLAKFAGQEITVHLSGRQKIKPGQKMIFHAVSWIYGDSIAVRSLSQEPVKASHMALLSAASDPVEQRAQRMKRERFDDADLVVSGKVLAVRLPSETSTNKKVKGVGAGLIAQSTRKPVSEHDPKWREAIVEVADVHKGSHKKKQVVVRFPASMDVMWHQSPKFQPGQQGYFMLQKSEAKTTGRKPTRKATAKGTAQLVAAAPAVAARDSYVALDPADFQPFNEPGGVKSIIESANDAGKK